jgi:preprotein translocase subunit SecG
MEILRYALIVVEVLCCLMLIGVILLQQSKSQGMGLAFGGGMGETLFGSRAGNVLTKITVVLAFIFLANTTVLGILFTTSEERSLLERAAAPAAPLPIAAPAPSPEMLTTQPQSAAPQVMTFDDQPATTPSAAGDVTVVEPPTTEMLIPMEIPADAPVMDQVIAPAESTEAPDVVVDEAVEKAAEAVGETVNP